MSIGQLALVLVLASFALLSGAAHLLLPLLRSSSASATAEARLRFSRAIAPTVIPAAVAVAVLLPSFLVHEAPREEEWPGLLLVGLACAGAVRLGVVAVRGFQMVLASRALVRAWLREATALPTTPWGAPTSKIDVGFPVVAVAGFFRPHVLVDRRVLEACSCAELEAIAAHERAHILSYDNLRRLLVAACAGHTSEAALAWRVAAERAADDRAVNTAQGAVDLACALVRLARAVPAPALPVAAISTVHDGGSLQRRVQRLLEFTPAARQHTRAWPAVLASTVVVLGLTVATPLARTLHAGLELLVRHLP